MSGEKKLSRSHFLRQPYEIGGRLIDPSSRIVTWKGGNHALPYKCFQVMAILAEADGELVTREQFIELVWSGNALVGDKGLSDTIYQLRRALDDGSSGHFIRTIPRQGYRLDERVHRVTSGFARKRAEAHDKPTAKEMIGQTLGPYQLLDLIGTGGMGTVYLAEQRAPIHRQVALKLVKPGMDTDEALARFSAERQALALLNHPNIAAVYDAGAAQESGRPYFVMEYVPGLDITAHCNHFNLRLDRRVRLFLQVCDGLQHAHQKGLIHRDIKPGNILVKHAVGDSAVVKIIDFGVAKSLQSNGAPKQHLTGMQSRIGTATYSSPEQMSSSRLEPDIRTDVYSLGIMLFEILAGVTPYNSSLASKTNSDQQLLPGSVEPQAVGKRFSGLEISDKLRIAKNRSTSPDKLEKFLSGELSWIVGRCINRDPDDRYPSVLELKHDLVRWLEDRPVQARPTSRIYRIRKALIRHRGAVAAASAFTIVLLATTALAIFGFIRAETEAERARDAARQAELAAEFQVKQLKSLDVPAMSAGLRDAFESSIRVQRRELDEEAKTEFERGASVDQLIQGINFADLFLDQLEQSFFEPALATIDSEYQAYPRLQARLWQSSANTLFELGRLDAALGPQEKALEMRLRTFGPTHPLTAQSLRDRGRLYGARTDFDAAERDLREALAVIRDTLGDHHPETYQTMSDLAIVLHSTGNSSEEASYMQRAFDGRRRLLGEDHPDTLESIQNLGDMHFGRGQFETAESQYRQALERRRIVLGPGHPQTLDSMDMLARALKAQGRIEDSLTYLEEVLERRRSTLGEEHPATMVTMNVMASSLEQQGSLSQAEAQARRVLDLRRRVLGQNHPTSLLTMADLGRLMSKQSQFDEGERYLREALRGLRQAMGLEHRTTLRVLIDLAEVFQLNSDWDQAEEALRLAIQGSREVLGAQHPQTLAAIRDLTRVLQESDRFEAANEVAADGMALISQSDPLEPTMVVSIARAYAKGLVATGRFSDAERMLTQTLGRLEDSELKPALKDELMTSLVSLYEAWGEADPGQGYRDEATQWRERLSTR